MSISSVFPVKIYLNILSPNEIFVILFALLQAKAFSGGDSTGAGIPPQSGYRRDAGELFLWARRNMQRQKKSPVKG
jgi:hypothetical protein